MRPKICVPIVAPLRDGIIREAKQIAKLPVEMVEWRIDFFAGYGREILDVITELKRVLNEKELLVTIRTVAEGGEENGSRFDYFETIRKILEQQTADYIEADIRREANLRFAFFQPFTTFGCDDNHTIGSTDTIKCRSSLSFQDVDTFNIIRVDIYRTVGEVGSAHTTIVLNVCANVRRTGYRHSVDNVKRSVVTRERTCTTDGDL